MKKPLIFFLLWSQLQTAYCQYFYFQQQVNYKIDVTLNDIENTLDGFEIIEYTNNSPDTLRFIWFHLWPNAYKNDRTAFSEQLLQLGRTDFYFSSNEKRGYINRLDFQVNGITSVLEDHPKYIDVAKLILPVPLAPGKTIKITTPFHEKIPFNFSRGGHVGSTYQITQWYPKPAVYDSKGWHPMPYLDQGEFYSEFGNFNVQITLPDSYVVAATGELQNAEEIKWLKEKAKENTGSQMPVTGNQQKAMNKHEHDKSEEEIAKNKETVSKRKIVKKNHKPLKKKLPVAAKKKTTITKKTNQDIPKSEIKKQQPARIIQTKTLNYIQNNVHDFAWFAAKDFIVNFDTLKLPSGRIIDAYTYFTPSGKETWKNSISFIKDAITTRSKWLGEYPYNIVTAVEAKMGFDGGMEYPTITSISPMRSQKAVDLTIQHEVGHNWNYGILASNEREHPWIDEGMNT
ncbi:MAG: M1 family metallopeptidase, partial [Ginsengibacter sp.]